MDVSAVSPSGSSSSQSDVVDKAESSCRFCHMPEANIQDVPLGVRAAKAESGSPGCKICITYM